MSDRSYYGSTNSTTGHVNADDIGCVVEAWQSAATRLWVAGNFAWTGTDYKGEPSPLNVRIECVWATCVRYKYSGLLGNLC